MIKEHHISLNTTTPYLHAVIRGDQQLLRAYSGTLDFEPTESSQLYHITSLFGSWARENSIQEVICTQGMHSFGSVRGRYVTVLQ